VCWGWCVGSRRGSSSTPSYRQSSSIGGGGGGGGGRSYNGPSTGLYDHNEDTPSPISATARDSPIDDHGGNNSIGIGGTMQATPRGRLNEFGQPIASSSNGNMSNNNNNNNTNGRVDMRRRAIAQSASSRSPVSARQHQYGGDASPSSHHNDGYDSPSGSGMTPNRPRSSAGTGVGTSNSGSGNNNKGWLSGGSRWPLWIVVGLLILTVMVLLRQRSNMIRQTGAPLPPPSVTEPSGASSYTTSGGRGRTPTTHASSHTYSKPGTSDGNTINPLPPYTPSTSTNSDNVQRSITIDDALPELERIRTRVAAINDDTTDDNNILTIIADQERAARAIENIITNPANNDDAHSSSKVFDVMNRYICHHDMTCAMLVMPFGSSRSMGDL
jgi:hypothetical protein